MCAVGTGTMMTGLINSSLSTQQVIGIPVLKMVDGGSSRIADYVLNNSVSRNFEFHHDFHFGGYAKKNNELIDFMNALYFQQAIPTDFVYTGKLFYGAMKLIQENFFKPATNLLLIHSGGLQGNRSLPAGTLRFSN
jgi:D-cysteine desulfhydrase